MLYRRLWAGYLNGELYNSKSLSISPSASLTYEYGELLTVNPQYSFNYNTYDYSNYRVSSSSAFTHRASLEVTSYWPKNLVFGNDIGYTFNSNIAPGFRKDFYMWNSSLGYNFMEDTLLLRIKVYDVLNQNTGASRTIGATNITDQENRVLKRYVMFSLTYKLKKFGSKEKK